MSLKSASSRARASRSSFLRSSPTSSLPFPLPLPLAAATAAAVLANGPCGAAESGNPNAFLSARVGSASVFKKALYPFKVELTAIQGEWSW